MSTQTSTTAKLEAGSGDVDEIGHASVLELEGIFLHTTKEGFALAVVHRGLVNVVVPDGMLVPPFKAGDQIEVLVRVGDDGTFTFMKGRQDERDYGKGKDGGEYQAEGVLVGQVTALGERPRRARARSPARSRPASTCRSSGSARRRSSSASPVTATWS